MENKKRKDLIGAIHKSQDKSNQNFISNTQLMQLAKVHDVPIVEASGIVSFYSQFSSKPRGKFILGVCDSLSCRISGSVDIFLYLQSKLGINSGQTTEDGLFTLEVVPCIGSCDTSPNILINHSLYKSMNPDKIDEMIKQLSKEGENDL